MALYFIVDDWCHAGGFEGFEVLFGDPVSAVGTSQGEFRTLRAALESIPKTERVYRVKLARRHGLHTVRVIRDPGFSFTPFREHDMWQARGFDADMKHFNRAFNTRRSVDRFLSAMKNHAHGLERY